MAAWGRLIAQPLPCLPLHQWVTLQPALPQTQGPAWHLLAALPCPQPLALATWQQQQQLVACWLRRLWVTLRVACWPRLVAVTRQQGVMPLTALPPSRLQGNLAQPPARVLA